MSDAELRFLWTSIGIMEAAARPFPIFEIPFLLEVDECMSFRISDLFEHMAQQG